MKTLNIIMKTFFLSIVAVILAFCCTVEGEAKSLQEENVETLTTVDNSFNNGVIEGYVEDAVYKDNINTSEEIILYKFIEENYNSAFLSSTTIENVINEYKELTKYTEVDPYTMYINAYSGLREREVASDLDDDTIIDTLAIGTEITIIGIRDDEWVAIQTDDTESGVAYVCSTYIQDTKPVVDTYNHSWSGEKLNSYNGRVAGPSGNETYYNMDMSYIVERLHSMGYEGDYWVREDGVKMFGDYVMVAAAFDIRPIGTLLPTSLGTGIVCDTGGFISWDYTGLDIATTW